MVAEDLGYGTKKGSPGIFCLFCPPHPHCYKQTGIELSTALTLAGGWAPWNQASLLS